MSFLICASDAENGCATSGDEEPLEAIYMAMCRAVDNPPEACFDEINQFTQVHVGSNSSWLA